MFHADRRSARLGPLTAAIRQTSNRSLTTIFQKRIKNKFINLFFTLLYSGKETPDWLGVVFQVYHILKDYERAVLKNYQRR